MAVYDLEEQEQIAEIKAWWGQYGNLIVGVLLAAAVGFAGWTFWGRYQSGKAGEAGALYAELQQAAAHGDEQKAREIAGRLVGDYGGTAQAQLGALLSAGAQFKKNDLDNALPQLEWAADKGKDPELRALARLRLAAVLLQKGDAAAALERLQAAPDGPWRARFEDLRGDALATLGKPAEARTAWQAALNALGGDAKADAAPLADVIRAKLESLEG